MTTLPQTALAALAEAGCRVPSVYCIMGQPVYGQPAVEDMMDFIGEQTGSAVALERAWLDSPDPDSMTPVWEASGYTEEGQWHSQDGESPRLALYALALAVGAVKEGTDG